MSDESFFREVNEELRQDRLKSIWTRFGTAIVVVVVVLILATAAFVGWERYSRSQANQSGDRYLAAQNLVADGDVDGALEAFRAIAADGWGAYPDLARMSIGNTQASAGRVEDAIASYADVAADTGIPASLREMADLRAAYLLVDIGSLADVRAKAERLTGEDNPLRYAARDAIAMAAWKAGDTQTARDLYQSITDAGDVPAGIAQRAALILGLIAAEAPVEEVSQAGESQAGARTGATADAAQPSANSANAETDGRTQDDTVPGTTSNEPAPGGTDDASSGVDASTPTNAPSAQPDRPAEPAATDVPAAAN